MFVLFLVTTGVVAGIMMWAVQHVTMGHNLPPNNSTNSSESRHLMYKRSIEPLKQNCTADRIRSTTLCVPVNTTTTVTLTWGTLASPGQGFETHALFWSRSVWYMTEGGYSKWSWKNLVAETGPDWSSWTVNRVALLWRRRLVLTKVDTGLKLVIKHGVGGAGCTPFLLAPWEEQRVYWHLKICILTITTPRAVLSVRKPLSSSDPRLGPVTMTTAPPKIDDAILMATGVSGFTNNWLLLAEEAANSTRQSCVVCMGARPLLRIVPAVVILPCLIPLMTTDNPCCNCTTWDRVYPITKATNRKPMFSNQVAKANFTCVDMSGVGIEVGRIPKSWCLDTVKVVGGFKPISRADVWWWCGTAVLFDKLPVNTTGTCALVTLLLPVSVYPIEAGDLALRIQSVKPVKGGGRSRRATSPSMDDPTYIDAVGVPRGVPDKYKLVDQVAAGFESSICWWCTINKNVDRINYIHYNVQKLGNWTQQGFEAVHGQLAATSLMAFQNRIAIDMLISEKGGVCAVW
ncbi:uncharacterized protein LOC116375799 [Oncorhynchus kisutch]|uniref:Uncharacterized LOC116375799 n=1 Tax=Oncorhynchus kisutch TaxID=8019 RepID=A0A8C7JIA3_ONCKI|nr:uncharacterized protein LOC116375799 [Oncorhynchus kisutch]